METHYGLKLFLLVLVPRHPQRIEDVAALVAKHGFKLQRRSSNTAVGVDTQVWLGDSMGELFAYYAACDVAFVGGSLIDHGGQNLIGSAFFNAGVEEMLRAQANIADVRKFLGKIYNGTGKTEDLDALDDEEIVQLPPGFRVVAAPALTVPGLDAERHLIVLETA